MIWSRIVASLAGLAIAIASVVVLFTLAISPIMRYDYDGFEMLQTKSGVYTRGFTLEESLGIRSGIKMFNEAHIVMLPAVDAQIQFSSTYTGSGRVVRVYEHGTPADPLMMPLRVGGNYIFAGAGSFSWTGVSYFPPLTAIDANPWVHAYRMDANTVYNKGITFRSWLGTAAPSYNGATFFTAKFTQLRDLSNANGGFNLMVNGAPKSSDLLFYTGNRPERYVWLAGQTP